MVCHIFLFPVSVLHKNSKTYLFDSSSEIFSYNSVLDKHFQIKSQASSLNSWHAKSWWYVILNFHMIAFSPSTTAGWTRFSHYVNITTSHGNNKLAVKEWNAEGYGRSQSWFFCDLKPSFLRARITLNKNYSSLATYIHTYVRMKNDWRKCSKYFNSSFSLVNTWLFSLESKTAILFLCKLSVLESKEKI